MHELLKETIAKALQQCLDLKPEERFLVITDKFRRSIGVEFFEVAAEMGAEAVMVEIIPTGGHGMEPPAQVANLWKQSDVFVAPTTFSLTHTMAREEACDHGSRGATLPGITEEILTRALNVDYNEMARLTQQLCEILNHGRKVRLITPAGTDLTFSIGDREAQADNGLYREPGQYGNLPAGEAYIAPMEETAEGIMVVDGAMAGEGEIDQPITIEIKKGLAVSFSGGQSAENLRELLAQHPAEAATLAEFGIGTNPAAKISQIVLEDEKVLGTVHLALGNNLHFGGNIDVPIHLDGILKSPTFWIDDKLVMENGLFKI